MIEERTGKVQAEWYDVSFDSRKYCPRIVLRWTDTGLDGEELNIMYLRKESAENLIRILRREIDNMEEHEQKIQKIISQTSFSSLYDEFERKYNPYPVQMAREAAFRHALLDHLIDADTYDAAKRYYAGLWNYVGD